MSKIEFPRECFDNCVLTTRHNVTLEDLAIYAEFNDEIGAHGDSLKSYLINSKKSYQSQGKLLFNEGIVEGAEGAIKIIDIAIKEGFDLEFVKSALQLGTAGLETRKNQPLHISAEEAAARMRKVLKLLKRE